MASSRFAKKRKIIVMIPTVDRPKYLNATLLSVLRHAEKHGHNVEIVVSDLSKKSARKNAAVARNLRRRFPKIPLWVYSPRNNRIIRGLLKMATPAERRAYARLVPKDGERGANRNRLALLAVYHGGENAAYLHLDDDTPLFTADKTGIVRKNPRDVLGDFITAFEHARKKGLPGYMGSSTGVQDQFVSAGVGHLRSRKMSLREAIQEGLKKTAGLSINQRVQIGPGRILDANATLYPYPAHGSQEDLYHLLSLPKRLLEPAETPGKAAQLLHIGISGFQPDVWESLQKRLANPDYASIPPELKPHWKALGSKMLELTRNKKR